MKKIRFSRILFYSTIVELFLMGSGQDFHIIGPLTLRMLNYLLAIVVSIGIMQNKNLPNKISGILFAFIVLTIVSSLIGLLNNADPENVFEDIKPLSYFLMLPFFYFMLSSEEKVHSLCKVMTYCGMFMAVLYIGYIIVTDFIIRLDHSIVYAFVESENIMFRGNGNAFFYKGFIYLPLAAIALLMEKKYIWFVVLAISIFFTYTRGLYLLLFIGFIFVFLSARNVNIFKMLMGFFVIYLFYYLADSFGLLDFSESFMESHAEGDTDRLIMIRQVMEKVNFMSAFVGHGFGVGIEIRPIRMEISFLEIFHKQGIVGILFWGMVLLQIVMSGNKVRKDKRNLVSFFVITSFMIYMQSFFNPYINNPIGMGWILLSYASCYRLSHEKNFCNSSYLQRRIL